ncbi:hypothetical protein CBER1_07968 [Cercospora berteroae]|uniref:Uncharacterized protein n=1 Tax=Cercospora berteroae TaxID=357750 RepID=A0A2S6BVK8_9PEZI|nr:hypothetical protein CBER1_07968 [Cercospora berteroae]
MQPPLTRVCRQIREETLKMFYHGNTFVMEFIATTFRGHDPMSDNTHQRTKEVSAWLQCTSQEHHDTIKHAKLVICKPELENVHFTNWQSLINILKQCGYACEGGKQKLDAVMHSITDAADYAGYVRLWIPNHPASQVLFFVQATNQDARRFFKDLGLDVEVNLTFMPSLHFEGCGNCEGMPDLSGVRDFETQ